MDAAHHWPQEIVVKPIDEIVSNAASICGGGAPPPCEQGKSLDQRKPRPQKEQAVNCPRCNSTNTKFCYYNNYSLTQPRYFCKTCRRYWTEGGSLRNIPVGGGSRKNKRSSSSSFSNISSTSNSTSTSTATTTTNTSSSTSKIGQNPSKGTQDLNLAFPPELLHLVPNGGNNLERGGLMLSSYMSMPLSTPHDQHPNSVSYTPPPPPGVFSNFHEIKPTLSFSLDGLGIGGSYGNVMPGVPDSAVGRMFFPFEELKQPPVSSSTSIDMEQSNNNHRGDHHHQQQGSDHNSNGYWSGMLGGGSW